MYKHKTCIICEKHTNSPSNFCSIKCEEIDIEQKWSLFKALAFIGALIFILGSGD